MADDGPRDSGAKAETETPGSESYRAVFEAAPDGILIVDGEGAIVELNPRAERMFGYDREEILGEAVERLVPKDSRAVHRKERQGYMEDPRARPMGIGMELEGRRKDGSHFPVEISLSPMRSSHGPRVISIVRDLTARRRLRDFGAGALRAAEAERRRIARELHDDTAQRLAGLLIRLRLLQRDEPDDRRYEALETLRREILESAEAIRRIARGLRPPALEDAGVETAIRSHVRKEIEHSELRVELDLEPVDALLSEDEALVVYRVVQEALSNVRKHAQAGRVRIALGREGDGTVRALVEDDGVGFRPRALSLPDEAGLGLLGMEERAHSVDGSLEVESEPGQGTRVLLRIPTAGTTRSERGSFEEGTDG